jgi:hypothetical protein
MQKEAFIHPCAKGFFIIEFEIEEDRDLIFNSRSVVLRKLRFVHETLESFFQLVFEILSSTPTWVRLPNLPFHFWGLPSLEAINGSTLGKFHFASRETTRHNTSTFSRICVEMEFSKGFPNEVILIGKNYSWSQKLDYERVSLH